MRKNPDSTKALALAKRFSEEEKALLKIIRSALRQAVKATDAATLARLTVIAFRQEFPVSNTEHGFANALVRAIPIHQKLMAAEGGSLSAQEVAQRLGISKTSVLRRYHKGQLIAWREELKRAFRFPAWQFRDNDVLEGLEAVLKVLHAGNLLDDRSRMLFFLSNLDCLGGARPLDCLRLGEVNKALVAAQGYCQ